MTSFNLSSCIRILATVFIGNLFAVSAALASDKAREMEIAEDILESLVVGETIWLEAGRQKFLGILTAALRKKPQGAVLLLHDVGLNPNSTQVIQPLRIGLAKLGWTTLSIQMPIPENEDDYDSYDDVIPEAVERINFALEVLTEKDYENIALIGHSFGALVAVNYLAGPGAEKFSASVAIGLSLPTEKKRNTQTLENFSKIKIPMLDIFGRQDFASMRGSAKRRKLAATNSPAYRQIEIDGADRRFFQVENVLAKRIYGWLKKKSKGVLFGHAVP